MMRVFGGLNATSDFLENIIATDCLGELREPILYALAQPIDLFTETFVQGPEVPQWGRGSHTLE